MTRKRLLWIVAPVGAVLVGSSVAWAMRDEVAYVGIATGYAAKQTCSCLHVSGRTLDACMAEYPADARNNIEVLADGDRVRARVLFGAIAAEAHFEEGYGCALIE